MVQCLAKAPASRLRASELAARLREQLPLLAGMPPLDVDEPDTEQEEAEQEEAPAATPARSERVRRGAVPSYRVPSPPTPTATPTRRCGSRPPTNWRAAPSARPALPAPRAPHAPAPPGTARPRDAGG